MHKRLTINVEVINTVDPGGGGGRSTIDVEVIDVEAIDTWRGSTVNFHFCMKRQSPLLILGGGEQINNQHREDQQSAFTFA